MNSPVSGLPAVAPSPARSPVTAPAPPPKRKRSWVGWILGLIVVAGSVAGWAYYRQAQETSRVAARAVTKTAVVQTGPVQRSIRLTGVTAAERFVSLVTPQLRGRRSGRGRDATTITAQTTQVPAVRSTSSATRSSGTSSSSSAGGDQSVNVSSTAGGGASNAASGSSSSPTAFQSATSRVSSSSRGSAPVISPTRTASSGSGTSSLGSDGRGSTSADLGAGMGGGGGGGGGGGSGSEFTLILQELVPPGSHVKKGDTVAEFDRVFMLQRVEDYQSSVEQQRASVAKMRAELAIYRDSHRQTILTAKSALDKARLDMKTTPVLSAIEAERVKLALDEAEAQYKQLLSEVKHVEASEKAQLRNAELELRSAELELRRAEQNADKMLARAAIDGMTVMQNMLRGVEFSQIAQGDQLWPGQFYMQIVDTSSMVVNANMNQVDAERLRIGQKATVRFDAYPDLALPAHVIAVSAVTKTGGFRANFVKEIPVRLKLDKVDDRVIPDLSVSADVVVEAEDAPAVVPVAAVFEDNPGGPRYVLVRDGNAWRRREVEVGLVSYTEAAIQTGLKPGEVVAVERPVPQNQRT